ncbi:hypothetical protein FRC02_009146 [Tulasnella sp. 418]|nr:hypothetical protein FRC02_009146 [Tulasnella sp. 418]
MLARTVVVLSTAWIVSGLSISSNRLPSGFRSGLSKRQEGQWPACAQQCLEVANLGTCDPSDNVCLCNSDAFISGIQSCFKQKCQEPDRTLSLEYIEGICSAPQIPISITTITTSRPTGTSLSGAASSSGSEVEESVSPQSSATQGLATQSSDDVENSQSSGASGLATQSDSSATRTPATSFVLVTSFTTPARSTGLIPATSVGNSGGLGGGNSASRMDIPSGARGLIVSAMAVLGGAAFMVL